VTLADQWYASAAFADTVALIAVAVIAMAVGAKAAIYAGFPKRRLYFSMPVIAPLLSAPEGIRGDLELRHKEISLDDPHLLEVKLISKSRRDIASGDFDSHEPLCLDIGANIIEILRTTSTPNSPPAPIITHEGTSLKIGPSLIGKRQDITVTLLADGPDPRLTYEARLINVDVREQKAEDPAITGLNLRLAREQAVAFLGVVVGLAALEIAQAESGHLSSVTAWLATFLLLTGVAAQVWMIVTVIRFPFRRSKAATHG
jgi:hypothetical protein